MDEVINDRKKRNRRSRPKFDDTIEFPMEPEPRVKKETPTAKPSLMLFSEILDNFIRTGSLDHLITQHQEKIDWVKSLPKETLISNHEVIKNRLENLMKYQPDLKFKPATIGAFFFGCYSFDGKYVTRNKYCDPLCAFAIPNPEDKVQVCYSNVVSMDPPMKKNNGQKTCVVHMGDKKTAELNPNEISELLAMGCSHISIYEKGKEKSTREVELTGDPERIDLYPKSPVTNTMETTSTGDYPVVTGLAILILLIISLAFSKKISS